MKTHSYDDWEHNDTDGTHVLKANVLIWLEEKREARNPFEDDWPKKFLDPKASSLQVVVRYGSVPLQTAYMVVVDGGRATLPQPSLEMTVSPLHYAIAVALNLPGMGRGGLEDLDDYMAKAGIRVK